MREGFSNTTWPITGLLARFASRRENASTLDSHCHIPITVVAEEF
jgi:hypothetical protein